MSDIDPDGFLSKLAAVLLLGLIVLLILTRIQ